MIVVVELSSSFLRLTLSLSLLLSSVAVMAVVVGIIAVRAAEIL